MYRESAINLHVFTCTFCMGYKHHKSLYVHFEVIGRKQLPGTLQPLSPALDTSRSGTKTKFFLIVMCDDVILQRPPGVNASSVVQWIFPLIICAPAIRAAVIARKLYRVRFEWREHSCLFIFFDAWLYSTEKTPIQLASSVHKWHQMR